MTENTRNTLRLALKLNKAARFQERLGDHDKARRSREHASMLLKVINKDLG